MQIQRVKCTLTGTSHDNSRFHEAFFTMKSFRKVLKVLKRFIAETLIGYVCVTDLFHVGHSATQKHFI